MKVASSNSGSPAVPMKLVATPRPEKNDWKSIVGPWMVALRPPAHSTWATLRPPRSADWAIVSTWRTPGSKAAVRAFVNGWPTVKNVLLVEPWTPGQAPVARRVPAGARVRRRLGQQAAVRRGGALLEELAHRRHDALPGVLGDQVLAHAVGREEDRVVVGTVWAASALALDRRGHGCEQQRRTA